MTNSTQDNLNLTTGGARTLSIYTERKIKIFPVSEPELDSISNFNTISITFFSFGSFLLSLFIDNIRYSKSEDYSWILDPFIWTALLIFIFGSYALFKKGSMLKKIKKQSQEIPK